jgi:transposase
MFNVIRPIVDRLCIGIDLHKDTMTVAVLDPRSGQVSFTRLACKCRQQIVDYFTSLPRPHVVAIESVGFYRWLWELLEGVVCEPVLADATQCRALAGRRIKTDREDALNVAELLAAGRLPRAWAPPTPIATLRDVTRHRHHLSRQHARVLHRVKAIMLQLNRPGPARMKAPDLLRYLKAQRGNIPAHFVEQMVMAVDELVLLERQLDRIDLRLQKRLEEPAFHDLAGRLMSFPGIGVVLSAVVIAEVGDFGRFEDRDALVRFAGLDPRIYNSADSVRSGRISKQGSRELRWALVQAAWTAVRCDASVKNLWIRIRKRSDGKRAIIAIARRLLLWMRAAVRDGKVYQKVA